MGRPCKCYGKDCVEKGLKYPKEELIYKGSKGYCSKCYAEIIEEEKQRNLLYKYIEDIYNISFPTAFMLKQIKDFKERDGIDYKNQRFTLKYAKDILGLDLQVKFGVAIIGYRYHEMLEYCKDIEEKKKQSENIGASENQVIKINPKRRTKPNKRLLDINNIELRGE